MLASTDIWPRIANCSPQSFVAGRVVYVCMYGTEGVFLMYTHI